MCEYFKGINEMLKYPVPFWEGGDRRYRGIVFYLFIFFHDTLKANTGIFCIFKF